MKRKTFLKLSSMVSAAPLILPLNNWAQQERLKNWAGNFEFSTTNVHYPRTINEVQALVKKLPNLRTLGTRHCFNRIADSKHNLVSTRELNKVVDLDTQKRTVTVEAGIKYGELAPWLHNKGFALSNLASLPHISVAGSVATATHGSGVKNKSLAAAVNAIEIVRPDGSVAQISRAQGGDDFPGSVVNLGALGVVTKVSLDVEPTFMMHQHVYLRMPLEELRNNFDNIVSEAYSVSLFTDWQNEYINEVWVKSRTNDPDEHKSAADFYGGKAATKNMHPIAELSAENCTEQMGAVGPWHERLPHFKMGFTPSSGKELQAEYFVPISNAVDAISAIQRLGKQISPHLFISEIRTVAADELWMSPCYKQQSVAIHFTWQQHTQEVMSLLPVIEAELMPYKVKPHWGKLFTMSPTMLAAHYERWAEFQQLITSNDPKGKLKNDFMRSTLSS